MQTLPKIFFILFCGFSLSGYGAAGCAINAAAQLAPVVIEAAASGVKTAYNAYKNRDDQETYSPTTDAKTPADSNKDLCLKAVRSDKPKWDNSPNYKLDVAAAKSQGLSEIECARLSGRFLPSDLALTANNSNQISSLTSSEICAGAISNNGEWNDNEDYVIEAKHRLLTKSGCSDLQNNQKVVENNNGSGISDVEKTASQTANESCPGAYDPSWNDCKGIRTFSDNTIYNGHWKSGKQHGQGTLTYADGEKYVGGFKSGLHHGKGTVTYSNGKTMTGRWENDKFKGN